MIIIRCKSLTPALQAETKAANRREEFDGFPEHELRAQADAFGLPGWRNVERFLGFTGDDQMPTILRVPLVLPWPK